MMFYMIKKFFGRFRAHRVRLEEWFGYCFLWRKRAAFILSVFCLAAKTAQAHAAQEPAMPPHLIQSVQDKDIYEGMAALRMMQCTTLKEEDCALAYENVKESVLRVQMGIAHGSGVIWEFTPEEIVIATNRHVLEYWDDSESYVYFPQGYYVDAHVLGVSKQYDVGFLAVDIGQFHDTELLRFQSVPVDETVYSGLGQGDRMFTVEAASEADSGQFYEGTVEDTYRYIEDLGAFMLYGHGFAKEGMSGGGTFDGRGYLIGMTTGGTMLGETASVPLPDIIKAYDEMTAGP